MTFRILALFLGIVAYASAADLAGAVVTDHDGSPVLGAAVTLRQSSGGVIAELETDDAGRFRAPLAAGQYVVSITKSNFAPIEQRVQMAADNQSVNIRMIRLGAITGTVMDSRGQGVRNVVIAAIPAPTDGGPVRIARQQSFGAAPDSRGRYRVHGLTPGSYVVAMAVGDVRSNIAPITDSVLPDTSLGTDIQLYPSNARPEIFTVRGGEEHKVNFTVLSNQLATIRGTVSGTLAPNTAYTVSLQRADLPSLRLTGLATTNGEFEFTRVAPGAYRIAAAAARQPNVVIVDGQPQISQPTGKFDPVFGETRVNVAGQDVTGIVLGVRGGIAPKLVYQPSPGCPDRIGIALVAMEDWGAGVTNMTFQAGQEVTFPALPPSSFSVRLNLPQGVRCISQPSEIDLRQSSSDAAITIRVIPDPAVKP